MHLNESREVRGQCHTAAIIIDLSFCHAKIAKSTVDSLCCSRVSVYILQSLRSYLNAQLCERVNTVKIACWQAAVLPRSCRHKVFGRCNAGQVTDGVWPCTAPSRWSRRGAAAPGSAARGGAQPPGTWPAPRSVQPPPVTHAERSSRPHGMLLEVGRGHTSAHLTYVEMVMRCLAAAVFVSMI